MADNYLEKRMEELRSGKLAVKGAIPGIKPGSQRIVVVGGTAGLAREKVLEFRKQGCRVAVFDSDETEGKRMAYEHGVRFHRIGLKEESALSVEMAALLNTWRGIDVIVGDTDSCQILNKEVANWKDSLPIADNSKTKIVIL